ncbi:DUF2752 domain-containing protein [Hominenteromicrobium mulieris]|uniref:DUF2752 domain-containing protein n=1 Tax=Hominenteromicrobium TaxID=3073575 RepID=UPI003A8C8CB4
MAAVFGAAAVLVVLYILRPPCLVRKVFGVLCPSCGTTRMIAALLQLDFAGAWALNPFMLFFLPFALLWGVLEAVRYAKGKPPLLFKRFSVALWAAWFLSALIFGVWRNFA